MPLFLLAIAAGFLTVLAPCILPLLPLILGTSAGHGRHRPFFVVLGFVFSFSIFGAFFATVGTFFGISNETFRLVAVLILVIFGLALIFERAYQKITTAVTAKFQIAGNSLARLGQGHGQTVSALFAGASLGLIWTPCAGPILGTIITLASQTKDPLVTGLLFSAYAVGAGIPMLLIGYGGQALLARFRRLGSYAHTINIIMGMLILLTALAIFLGWDRYVQTLLLPLYPSNLLGL